MKRWLFALLLGILSILVSGFEITTGVFDLSKDTLKHAELELLRRIADGNVNAIDVSARTAQRLINYDLISMENGVLFLTPIGEGVLFELDY